MLIVRNRTRDRLIAADVGEASSFWTRFRGLMLHAGVPGGGLWFPGTSSIHMLFMRFAIDCLFLGRPAPDGSRIVVGLRRKLEPWRGVVWYTRGADGALELAVGTIEASGTQLGDAISFERAG